MITKLKYTGLLLITYISFFSCGYSKEDAEKYLPGTYTYEIPSGELQVLKINSDFTFKQIIYSKNKKDILYENKGNMQVDKNRIVLYDWLECYELAEQKMLSEPRLTDSYGSGWRKPDPKRNKNVLIIKFDETNYIFKKINNVK